MIVFKCNEKLSGEEYTRWRDYIMDNWKSETPIVLPDYFDVFEFGQGEEVEYEES